jgi:hypothetical protein
MLPVPPRPDDEPGPAREAPADNYTGWEYVLLEANSPQALQETVNAYLRQGWRLQGGVAVATTGALHWWYYQAVVGR